MIDYLLYLVYRLFKFIVKITPVFLVKYFLYAVAKLIYLIDKKHRRIARANLDLAFGDEKTQEQKEKIIKESYLNLVFNLYEFIENQDLNLEGLEKKITVENEEVILNAIKENRKIILVTAHYGNWEYLTSFISLKYKPITVVGRPMNNKYLNDDLRIARSKHNSQMLDRKGAGKGLVKALKEDRLIGLVVDQHTSVKRGGILIDFFDKKAMQSDTPARLASKFDALIIPLFFIKNSFRNYKVKFYEAIDIKEIESEDIIKACTQKQADVIVAQIKNKPDDWFWQHKRWKETCNEIYK